MRGMQKGFDLELLDEIYEKIKKPLIFSGGCGKLEHINIIKNKYENVVYVLPLLYITKK